MVTKLLRILACWFITIHAIAQPGTLDQTFDPGAGADFLVWSTASQPDGKIVVGGEFTSFDGIAANRIVRLNVDGSVDETFNAGAGTNAEIHAIVVEPNGRIVVAGSFTEYNGVARNRIVRLNVDGSLDPTFDPGSGIASVQTVDEGSVFALITQSDGKYVLAGGFGLYNGFPRRNIVRVNPDGSIDTTFDPGIGTTQSFIQSLAIQSDGKLLVGGAFLDYNGIETSQKVIRLNTNGSVDESFISPDMLDFHSVTSILVQQSGSIVISGLFPANSGGPSGNIARLNTDGSMDESFSSGTGANGDVWSTLEVAAGKIVISGGFTSYNGQNRGNLARLNPDGSLDASFEPISGSSSFIGSLSEQVDGKIIIGGLFATYDGFMRNNIARVNGEQLCSDYILQLQSDAISPSAVTYEVLDETGTTTVISGNNPVAANAVGSMNLCLADGCYRLRVTDAAGDGLLGYILRESGTGGRRIIDNSGNMNTGVSAIASGGTFCVPIGDDALIHSSCDKLHWALPPNQSIYIVSAANPAVSAEWVLNAPNSQQDANSGYEFWFFDPNGSYSFRTFRSHNTSGGYGVAGPNRACHLRLNGWTNSPSTPHLPSHTLLNVRVRGRVEGVNFEFGPACQFEINPELAACPRVNLQDDPAFSTFSCGVSRNFGGPGSSANRITVDPVSATPTPPSNQVRYQFRFRIPDEDICIVRPPQSSATLTMNWTSGTPLECGKTYDVDVRVSLNAGATWCFGPATTDQAAVCADTEDWGIVCQVTINPCELPEGGGNSMAVQEGELTLYPNPNRSDRLFLNLTELDPEVSTVNVEMYDLTGKRALVRSFAASYGQLNASMDLGGQLSSGLYLVHVTAGTRNYTERLLIQP
jgi:uncharacterized delta-60 repeat protein